MNAVIVANGKFPEHPKPLRLIHEAKTLLCCDGSIEHLVKLGITPTAIVGDLDSVSPELRERFKNILFHDPDQNSNDLTKAVSWCAERNINSISIVGATGKREDHTVGNIGLLVRYARMGLQVEMVTDTGTIKPLLESAKLTSFPGQQISIFSPVNKTTITTNNLKYPIDNGQIPEWWMGTLNESLGSWFELNFSPGPLIVYQMY